MIRGWFRREFAPHVGVQYRRAFGDTRRFPVAPKATPPAEPTPPAATPTCLPEHRAMGHY